MELSIVIVSYNTAALTLACLESLQTATGDKELFVVDNASSDNSVELITARFPAVKLIANKNNKGFGAANNQGLLICNGRYVIFLNPDTSVKPDTLKKAVAFMDGHRQIGLAGAKILNPDGTLQDSVSYKYPGEKFTSSETAGLKGNIACVLGAFMIARKDLIVEMGGFDEDFFLYGEDQDLCWRIRERGYSIGYIEDAEVFHLGGQSEINTAAPAIFEKKLQAEYLFYSKHYRPETIARIKRTHARKARYRLLTLTLTTFFPFFARNSSAHSNKIQCYRIFLNMAKQ